MDIDLIADSVGWAVGEGGTIIKISDGWNVSVQTAPAGTGHLYAVDALNATTAYAVGTGGVVISRPNAAHTWVTTPLGEVLFYDGSSSWVEQTHPYPNSELKGVAFRVVSGNYYGVFVGDGGVVGRTSNGGGLWSKRANSPSDPVWAVDMVSTQVGLGVVGTNAIVTTSSGTSWATLTTPSPYSLFDIDMVHQDLGWIVGDAGAIMRVERDDTGYSFTPQMLPVMTDALFSVRALDANHAWACGDNGTVVRTTNGGSLVVAGDTKTTQSLQGIDFFDLQHGVAVGASGTVIWTSDGGDTWTAGTSGTVTDLTSVDMVSSDVGYAVGMASGPPPANGMQMLKTADGGQTWNYMNAPSTVAWRHLYGVDFADTSNGWIVGSHGTIMQTTDGGTTWQDKRMSDAWLYDVSAVSPTAAWAVGSAGAILTNYTAPAPPPRRMSTASTTPRPAPTSTRPT